MEPTNDLPRLRRPLPASEDRAGLIVVAGVLVLVGGSFAALVALFALVGAASALFADHLHRVALLPILVAATPPTLLLWLGVGLVRLRRWARPIGLVVAGGWLVAGLHLAAALGAAFRTPMYGGPQIVGLGLVGATAFGVLVPATLLALLARRDVARTLEARDLAPRRFTDGIPLAALALAFASGAAALWFAAMALIGHELPLPAGVLATPSAAAVGHLLLAAIAAVAATGIARGITLPIWISMLVTLGYAGLWLNRAATAPSRLPFVYLAGLMAVAAVLHLAAARALLLLRRSRISV
jgi:hypothetical protein